MCMNDEYRFIEPDTMLGPPAAVLLTGIKSRLKSGAVMGRGIDACLIWRKHGGTRR